MLSIDGMTLSFPDSAKRSYTSPFPNERTTCRFFHDDQWTPRMQINRRPNGGNNMQEALASNLQIKSITKKSFAHRLT